MRNLGVDLDNLAAAFLFFKISGCTSEFVGAQQNVLRLLHMDLSLRKIHLFLFTFAPRMARTPLDSCGSSFLWTPMAWTTMDPMAQAPLDPRGPDFYWLLWLGQLSKSMPWTPLDPYGLGPCASLCPGPIFVWPGPL